ncbi:MAG: hypothetical protein ACJ78Q_03265, partial [Chloroflexia bacterium]
MASRVSRRYWLWVAGTLVIAAVAVASSASALAGALDRPSSRPLAQKGDISAVSGVSAGGP